MKQRINEVLDEQIHNLKKLKESDYAETILEISKIIVEAIKNGGKLLIAGNGGSAADSQHFAAEIVGRFVLERKGYPAIALTTDTSILTAVGNDYGYDTIFSRQIEALGNEKDIFIGISTSGNSKNIINAINVAKEKKMHVIGMTGKDGGIMKDICDKCLILNYKSTARTQEHHIMSIHLICEYVEAELKKYYEEK
jgi:D-sedoheptulose 7-phosphate isomerase